MRRQIMAIHNPAGPYHSAPVSSAGKRRLVVSFHDLAPHTQRPCQELLLLLAELGVPRASLLVVPHWHGTEPILARPFFLRWLLALAAEGHEICLHGLTHRAGRVDAAGEEEFHRLGREEATARVREGEEIFAAAGLSAHGFVAPGWRLSPAAREVLRERGFEYTVTSRSFDLLQEDLRIPAPTVVFDTRGFLRRAVSPLVGRARFAASRRQSVLRVSVHPDDLFERGVRRALVSVLRRALEDREPVTYGELGRNAGPSHI
jgi:predicted deacetylase